MESLGLATLIVGAVSAIALIEFIMWLVIIIKHPGFDDLRPSFDQPASTPPGIAGSSRESRSSDMGR